MLHTDAVAEEVGVVPGWKRGGEWARMITVTEVILSAGEPHQLYLQPRHFHEGTDAE